MPNPSGTVETIRALVSDFILLVKQEFALARAEAEEKFEQVQVGVAAIAAGLLIALVALIVLVQALVVALANIMPPSIASLVVGVILALLAYAAIYKGQQNLKPKSLAPRRTVSSVRESAETIKDSVT